MIFWPRPIFMAMFDFRAGSCSGAEFLSLVCGELVFLIRNQTMLYSYLIGLIPDTQVNLNMSDPIYFNIGFALFGT